MVREIVAYLDRHDLRMYRMATALAPVQAAAAELEVQASLLDAMGWGEEAVVVLHVGGGACGREAAFDRFRRGLERLSERARAPVRPQASRPAAIPPSMTPSFLSVRVAGRS